jgi:hypothetical protein
MGRLLHRPGAAFISWASHTAAETAAATPPTPDEQDTVGDSVSEAASDGDDLGWKLARDIRYQEGDDGGGREVKFFLPEIKLPPTPDTKPTWQQETNSWLDEDPFLDAKDWNDNTPGGGDWKQKTLAAPIGHCNGRCNADTSWGICAGDLRGVYRWPDYTAATVAEDSSRPTAYVLYELPVFTPPSGGPEDYGESVTKWNNRRLPMYLVST